MKNYTLFSKLKIVFLFLVSMLLSIYGIKAQIATGDVLIYLSNLQIPDKNTPTIINQFDQKLIGKALTDECYFGLGSEDNYNIPSGFNNAQCTDCEHKGGTLKKNQSYVWGLTKIGSDIWMGTGSNILCLVFGTYLQNTEPQEFEDAWACQFGNNDYFPDEDLSSMPDGLKDLRTPRIFHVVDNPVGNPILTDKSDELPEDAKVLLNHTMGLRSAGSIDNFVFIAGPAIPLPDEDAGINIFVFDNSNKEFLGAQKITSIPGSDFHINDIRKWITVNDVLYTSVGAKEGGLVLKWTGNIEDLFSFEIVGEIPSPCAEIEVHNNNLYVGTWPLQSATGIVEAGIFKSPDINEELTSENKNNWIRIWHPSNYEPDKVIAKTYGIGDMKSYNGCLYWGTMHVPMTSYMAFNRTYKPDYNMPFEKMMAVRDFIASYRAACVFRGKDFNGDNEEIEVLYGQEAYPVYDPDTETWVLKQNKMNSPVFGKSGFNNSFNNYIWNMEVYNDNLFVGTMDWSFLLSKITTTQFFGFEVDGCNTMLDVFNPLWSPAYGADLYMFNNPNNPAIPVSLDGLGNDLSYGIRTSVSDEAIFIGMANPMNIAENGGWELNKLDFNVDIESLNDFISFNFLAKDNPGLSVDCKGVIFGNIIEIDVPENVNISSLIASYITTGNQVFISDFIAGNMKEILQKTGFSANSYAEPRKYTIYSKSGAKKEYWINIKKATSINEKFKQAIKIFPNPVETNLSISNANGAKIELVDLLGKNVGSFVLNSDLENVNISKLKPGIYIAKIIKDKQILVEKFEKK